MNNFCAGLVSWLLLPVAAYHGFGIRRRTPRIPPPRGPQSGQVGEGRPAYRILVMGDSSAAGVGADSVSDTLGPQLARIVNQRTGESVAWRNAGANSAMAHQVRDYIVPHIEARDFTHVVIAVGTNDMKNYVGARRFKAGFGGLLHAVHARWPEAIVLWSPVVHMLDVPALSPALAAILKLRTQIINSTGEQLCRERQAFATAPLPVHGAEGFADDGFHANAAGYRAWAEHVADVILAAPGP